MDLPSTFWDYMIRKWLADAPVFPISQVFGFSQYAAQYDIVTTQETTTSGTFGDLATPGPTISNIPKGQYVALYGAMASLSSAGTLDIAPSFNGDAPDTNNQVFSQVVGTFNSLARSCTASLAEPTNTVELKYATSAGTATFIFRWLVVFRTGNL